MTEPFELDCDQIVELITDYLEGVLEPTAAAAFEAHLAECDDCVTYVEQIKLTSRAVRNLRADQLPEAIRAGLLVAFRDIRPVS